MSRTWPPSRWAVVGALIVVGFSAGAAAQVTSTQRTQRAGSVITLGTPLALACGEFVARGVATDEAIDMCSRAFVAERLSRQQQLVVYLNRGVLYLRRQDSAEALADFDAALAIDDDQAEAHQNRGAALIQLRRYGEAVAALTEALSQGVQDPHKSYFNRGAAREALGDLRGAYEDYNTALAIRPDWGPAEAELARFARTRRDHLASRLADEPMP